MEVPVKANVLEISSCDLLSADDVAKFLFYFNEETFKLQPVALETQKQEVYAQIKNLRLQR